MSTRERIKIWIFRGCHAFAYDLITELKKTSLTWENWNFPFSRKKRWTQKFRNINIIKLCFVNEFRHEKYANFNLKLFNVLSEMEQIFHDVYWIGNSENFINEKFTRWKTCAGRLEVTATAEVQFEWKFRHQLEIKDEITPSIIVNHQGAMKISLNLDDNTNERKFEFRPSLDPFSLWIQANGGPNKGMKGLSKFKQRTSILWAQWWNFE